MSGLGRRWDELGVVEQSEPRSVGLATNDLRSGAGSVLRGCGGEGDVAADEGGQGRFLFESSWRKPYSSRGVRAMLARYAKAAGLALPISPHRLRHFLFTWLKTQGIDDALIQPYSGHESRQSLEICSRLALADAQATYDDAIRRFPV